jgi:hypothetical protein
VVGGIVLGPSLLGTYIPGFSERIFPPASQKNLQLVANIGYMTRKPLSSSSS